MSAAHDHVEIGHGEPFTNLILPLENVPGLFSLEWVLVVGWGQSVEREGHPVVLDFGSLVFVGVFKHFEVGIDADLEEDGD